METSRPSLAPLQEYLLQGSVPEVHRDVLLHRLIGLCDAVNTGPEKFHDHEIVLQLKGANVQPMTLRVRHALDYPESPWHLRYVGQPDMGEKNRPTLVRSCVHTSTSENLLQFLHEMGFRLDHEYVTRGYLFRKGRMKVTVAKIFRLVQPTKTDSIESLASSSLVELSVIATQGQDQIMEDMRNFADQLKPLVQLEKMDHKRLQQTSNT